MFATIIRNYKRMTISVKSGMWFTVCNFVQKGISMITIPIFTRLLSAEEYGVFSIYQSWYQILFILATLNLSGAIVNNGMSKYGEGCNEFLSAIQGLASTITIFFIYHIYSCHRFLEFNFRVTYSFCDCNVFANVI